MWAFPRASFELGISKVGRVRLSRLQNIPTSEFPPILVGTASFQAHHPLSSPSLHLFLSTPPFRDRFHTRPYPSGLHLGFVGGYRWMPSCGLCGGCWSWRSDGWVEALRFSARSLPAPPLPGYSSLTSRLRRRLLFITVEHGIEYCIRVHTVTAGSEGVHLGVRARVAYSRRN